MSKKNRESHSAFLAPGVPDLSDVATDTAATQVDGTPKPVESRADKFRRLASRRVSKALNMLRQVKALANKRQYDYTKEQADKIVDALNDAVAKIHDAYHGNTGEKSTLFEV